MAAIPACIGIVAAGGLFVMGAVIPVVLFVIGGVVTGILGAALALFAFLF